MEPEWKKWCRRNMPPELFHGMLGDISHQQKWRRKMVEEIHDKLHAFLAAEMERR